MHWSSDAIIIGARPHGETSAIVEVFARSHGRWRGLARGGLSRRMRPVLQPGNIVSLTWRARLEDQLGHFAIEPRRLTAGRLMDDPLALAGLSALMGQLHFLPEREPHPALHDAAMLILEHLQERGIWPALLARFELRLLADLGFGLDLSACAATGQRHDLAWVSPRSGRAVCAAAGEPYRGRLFPLPAFLLIPGAPAPEAQDVLAALNLTGYFLHRRICAPRGLCLPLERQWILDHLKAQAASAADNQQETP